MKASDVVGRRIVGVVQCRPPSSEFGRDFAVQAFVLDDGSRVRFNAVEDPRGDVGYVTVEVSGPRVPDRDAGSV